MTEEQYVIGGQTYKRGEGVPIILSDERTERVARAIWQRRLNNDDPNTHSLAWEEAIEAPSIWVAYEVQEIRRDADTAIAVSLPDPSEFMNAVDALIIASENATTFSGRNKRDKAINALWTLVYGGEGQRT